MHTCTTDFPLLVILCLVAQSSNCYKHRPVNIALAMNTVMS